MLARPLLILDLDETLVHARPAPGTSSGTTPGTAPGTASGWAPGGVRCGPYLVAPRPGLDAFLTRCRQLYDLAVWTSATADYAACVLAAFLADVPLVFVWSRERCTRRVDHETHEPYWVKDLGKVRRRGHDLARVLAIDDLPRTYERNHGNLVRVSPFTGDPDDGELAPLATYLESLAAVPDVRRLEKRGWRDRMAASADSGGGDGDDREGDRSDGECRDDGRRHDGCRDDGCRDDDGRDDAPGGTF